MLNSGEVPNLFEKDELEQVLAAIRPKAKEAGISEENRDEVHTDTNTHSTVESIYHSGSKNKVHYLFQHVQTNRVIQIACIDDQDK